MDHKVAVWFALTLASFAAGAAFGYAFLLLWFIIRVFILGYGDSGPSWINTVNDTVLYIGVFLGVVGGQLLYFGKLRKQSASPASVPPR